MINFLLTSTYLSNWDAQGLGGYKGAVWYRVDFKVPAMNKDKSIGLVLGGVDSVSKVWCNGKYVGLRQGYAVEHLYDLSAYIKSGANNKLAIEILRPSLSEIGVGGIIYPSFVFSGETVSGKVKKTKRLLPGGAETN